MVATIGHRFAFDGHMRNFLASDDTKSLGQVVDHWYASRQMAPPETLPQLELVRFTKTWHLAHPDGSAAQCRAAWQLHRSLPIEQRTSQ
jgi:hypothetical protein